MAKYLDDNGLLYFWQKIKTVFATQADLTAVQADVSAVGTLVGETPVSDQIASAVGALDSNVAAETNKAIASVTITNGVISASTKVTVPTNNNQLTNGAGYQTASDVTSAITAALAEKESFQIVVVSALPSSGENNTIYLVSSGSGSNIYNKYIWYDSQWVNIGSTSVDLSGYWAKADLTAITNSQIDSIVNTVLAG